MMPFDQAKKTYIGILDSLKTTSEVTSLVLATPIAITAALFSLPLSMFWGTIIMIGAMSETVFYATEALFTGQSMSEVVP